MKYCDEINQTHDFFHNDKEKVYSDDGFVYRKSVTMPILQIGEMSKNLSDDFRKENATIPWQYIAQKTTINRRVDEIITDECT